MTSEEKAREITRAYAKRTVEMWSKLPWEDVWLEQQVTQALREHGDAKLEEAAKVVQANAERRKRLAANAENGGRISRVGLHEECAWDSYSLVDSVRALKGAGK